MSKNYITDNQELEEFEKHLKSLSNELQTKYKEEDKYLYMRTVTKTITAILYPIVFVFLFLYLLAFLQPLSAITNIILIVLDIFLFIASVNFTTSYIMPRFKLPIVSKSRFLNNNLLKIKSDLLIRYSLEFQYITIDYDKIEFHLNQKAFAKFKNIKK